MSIHRTRHINGRAAENLLNGTGVDGPHDRLAEVLRAAAGPARPGELAGRQRALTAFRDARSHLAPPLRRRLMIKTAVLKLLTVKAAAVAALVAGTGGVALAASTGALPNPLNAHPAASASAGSHPSDRPGASDRPGGADPSPSLVGLCHAYTAGAGSDHGKALDSPAFQALLTAAGGKANVDAYCTKLLATADHSAGPSSGARPSDAPTGRPSDHPSGRPSDHPTDKPSQHPGH